MTRTSAGFIPDERQTNPLQLYREEDGLIWRIDSELGDECETLPRPKSIEGAKADVRLVYPPHSPFHPKADWL